ncbi:hypothetical protein ACROYT_G036372 [Oculina patagonica]
MQLRLFAASSEHVQLKWTIKQQSWYERCIGLVHRLTEAFPDICLRNCPRSKRWTDRLGNWENYSEGCCIGVQYCSSFAVSTEAKKRDASRQVTQVLDCLNNVYISTVHFV